ncbi:hypothetical protein KM043_016486 [Ampulex compressa]|nr:hypothetical protein KM043_016486 [Ampulex compressa]
MAAAIAADWQYVSEEIEPPDLGERAVRFRDMLTSICAVAIPRAKPFWVSGVYWWSCHIAVLRRKFIAARRRYTRTRGRREPANQAAVALLHGAYNEASAALQRAI